MQSKASVGVRQRGGEGRSCRLHGGQAGRRRPCQLPPPSCRALLLSFSHLAAHLNSATSTRTSTATSALHHGWTHAPRRPALARGGRRRPSGAPRARPRPGGGAALVGGGGRRRPRRLGVALPLGYSPPPSFRRTFFLPSFQQAPLVQKSSVAQHVYEPALSGHAAGGAAALKGGAGWGPQVSACGGELPAACLAPCLPRFPSLPGHAHPLAQLGSQSTP